jgi:hypothetical protein
MRLAFMNEFDVVCRADSKYILSLVDLYRSIYGLPPIQSLNNGVKENGAGSNPPHQTSRRPITQSTGREPVREVDWILPEPEYWHPQDIVIMKLRLKDIGEAADGGESEDGENENSDSSQLGIQDSMLLTTVRVTHEELAKLLFCRTAVHHRLCYKERLQLIAQGRFNNLKGWDV